MNDAALIAEAKKCLDGYHIDLSKYTVSVNRAAEHPRVHFTTKGDYRICIFECQCEYGRMECKEIDVA